MEGVSKIFGDLFSGDGDSDDAKTKLALAVPIRAASGNNYK